MRPVRFLFFSRFRHCVFLTFFSFRRCISSQECVQSPALDSSFGVGMFIYSPSFSLFLSDIYYTHTHQVRADSDVRTYYYNCPPAHEDENAPTSSSSSTSTSTSTKTRPVSYLRSSSASADIHMELRATTMSVAILQYIFQGGGGRKASVCAPPPTPEITKYISDLAASPRKNGCKVLDEEKPWIKLFSSSQGRKVFVRSEKITRKSTFEHKLNCNENSNTNTNTGT